MSTILPRIGIPADHRLIGDDPSYVVGEKYLEAVASGTNAVPIVLPAVMPEHIAAPAARAQAQLAGLDGLFLTGSPSNMEPWRYGGTEQGPGPFDPNRDAQNLALLQEAMSRDMPIFAACRGFQELNVACGGTLHTAVQDVPGYFDHRADSSASRDKRYAPAHVIEVAERSWLAQQIDTREFMVNSLHSQGINQLGPSLMVEGRSRDGLIEAIRHPRYSFVFGVQWHPEWSFRKDPVSQVLFQAFGRAVYKYRAIKSC